MQLLVKLSVAPICVFDIVIMVWLFIMYEKPDWGSHWLWNETKSRRQKTEIKRLKGYGHIGRMTETYAPMDSYQEGTKKSKGK